MFFAALYVDVAVAALAATAVWFPRSVDVHRSRMEGQVAERRVLDRHLGTQGHTAELFFTAAAICLRASLASFAFFVFR